MPAIDKIHKCSSAVEIVNFTAPDENGLVTYPGAASFFPAPWLLNAVVEASSSDPFILIAKAIEAAQAFDQDHDSNEDYITSAVNHVDDFIFWAWGVGASRVSKTKFAMGPNNNNLCHFHIERHQACISIPRVTWAAEVLPPPLAVSNLAVLGLLKTTISHQADKQEEQNKLLPNNLST
jgi:hypothetical protein